MTNANDSFLASMTRPRKVQSGVLDTLQQLAGKMTATPMPPVQVPVNNRITPAPQLDGVIGSDMLTSTGPRMESGSTPVAPSTSAPIPTSLGIPPAANLATQVDADIFDDAGFYQKTGRASSAADKALMDARSSFIMQQGRIPMPSELLYEVQRGMMASRNDAGLETLA